MLPVVDGDEIVGVYTLDHLAQRKDQPPAPPAAEDARASRVADHMTAEIPYVYEDDDLATAHQMLQRHDLPWLLVINRDDEYVGLISADAASGTRAGRAVNGAAPILPGGSGAQVEGEIFT